MKKACLISLLLAIHLVDSSSAGAVDRYVRSSATGANNGTDWTNAYLSLPATLVRGDVYYIADGTYSGYTFNTPSLGTTLITIKKATGANHGTDIGWLDSYGDGQAIFGAWQVHTDYWLFDGQSRNNNWHTGAIDKYGIRIKVPGGKGIRLDNGAGTGGNNLTFQYIDVEGGGRDKGDSNSDVIYGLTGNSNIRFQFCALHDSDRTIFLLRGNWQNLIIDHCYMARNNSNAAIHGELMSLTSATNLTFSNNVVEDTEGTAGLIAGLNGGTWTGGKIYGNTVRYTPAYLSCTGRPAGACEGMVALIYVANDASNNNSGSNILVYNNTFVNITQGIWSGVRIESGTGNVLRNNMWYNSLRTANLGVTTSNNWYYNTTNDTPGANDVTCTVSCNIFADLALGNFRLTASTSPGFDVGVPYDIDPSGIKRGQDGVWDRGAFEFSGTVSSVIPPAPQNLQVQ